MCLAQALYGSTRTDGVNFSGADEQRAVTNDFKIAKGAAAARCGPAKSKKLGATSDEQVRHDADIQFSVSEREPLLRRGVFGATRKVAYDFALDGLR
jgi:hypothetical protein